MKKIEIDDTQFEIAKVMKNVRLKKLYREKDAILNVLVECCSMPEIVRNPLVIYFGVICKNIDELIKNINK